MHQGLRQSEIIYVWTLIFKSAIYDRTKGRKRNEQGKREQERINFAHIGRPTIRALEGGKCPIFSKVGKEGCVYTLSTVRDRTELLAY